MNDKADLLREIDDFWTGDSLNFLQELADQIAEKLYFGVVTPLVETDDLVGGYLDSSVPYSSTAAQPYLEWCMHKYPPFDLKLSEDLYIKRLSIYDAVSSSVFEVDINLNDSLSDAILDGIKEAVFPGFDIYYSEASILEKQSLLTDLETFLGGIEITEQDHLNELYSLKLILWSERRRSSLVSSLHEISQNALIKHFETKTEFIELFEDFYEDFSLESYAEAELAKQVVKYRFLLHIIIIFLRVAGCEQELDLTIKSVSDYRNKINNSDSDFSSIRNALNGLPVNNTLPKGRELESIRSHAKKLMEKLNGRTKNYDLLMYLEELANASEDSFSVEGKLSIKKNIPVRAFMKALATFLTTYSTDHLTACFHLLDNQSYKKKKGEFVEKSNYLVERMTGIFFYDVSGEVVVTKKPSGYTFDNTKGVYQELFDRIEAYPGQGLNHSFNADGLDLESQDSKEMSNIIDVVNRYLGIDQFLPKKSNTIENGIEQYKASQLTNAGCDFWDDPFTFIGVVNVMEGGVNLAHVNMARIPSDDLREALNFSKQSVTDKKSALLRMFDNS